MAEQIEVGDTVRRKHYAHTGAKSEQYGIEGSTPFEVKSITGKYLLGPLGRHHNVDNLVLVAKKPKASDHPVGQFLMLDATIDELREKLREQEREWKSAVAARDTQVEQLRARLELARAEVPVQVEAELRTLRDLAQANGRDIQRLTLERDRYKRDSEELQAELRARPSIPVTDPQFRAELNEQAETLEAVLKISRQIAKKQRRHDRRLDRL